MIITVAAAAAVFTGLASILGGLQGFVKAGSRPSLIAGGLIGIGLLAGGILALAGWPVWLWLAAAGTFALLGRFLPASVKNPAKVWPGIVMTVLSAATLVLCVVARLPR